MPTCKYCGNETGGSQFCQNCGAKVDAEPVAPQPMPVYQQPFYTPGGAGGLLAGNIIMLVISVITCCLVYTLAALVMSIIGIVFAAKVKNAQNAEQERSYRKVALIMLLVSVAVEILAIILFVVGVYQKYGGFEGFFEELESIWESAQDAARR